MRGSLPVLFRNAVLEMHACACMRARVRVHAYLCVRACACVGVRVYE